MLESLHIENIAVIKSLDVDFSRGLSVITGETGAGKSVMIDAISFLLGAKPKRELLRNQEEQGLVSGVFGDLSPACLAYLRENGLGECDELLIQRSLTRDGKIKARLNGRVVTQGILRELAALLVNVHGQNDNGRLLCAETQGEILDTVAELGSDLAEYRKVFRAFREKECELALLARRGAEANRMRDVYRFQIAEIDAAKLKNGEEEALLTRRTKLQYAEKISKQSEFAYHVLHGSEKRAATLLLERAAQAMKQLSAALPQAGELADKLMNMRYEVEDVALTARDFAEDCGTDPTEELNRVEARLDAINKLRRKYGEDIAAILAFREQTAKALSLVENSDELREEIEQELKRLRASLSALADRLHGARERAAEDLSARILEQLSFLDMPSVRFEIAVVRGEDYGPNGADEIAFRIATNKGEPLGELSRIASGGELARIMLAVKSVLNDMDGVQTAIFDEVDTGISGKTALKIGIKLSQIGKHTQVICITHSAQIASLATTHLKITKQERDERAFTTVEPLDETGRVSEVARILGGLSVTKAQTDAAREMIEEGKCYR